MEIRELTEKDENSLFKLIDIIEVNLTDKSFWLPIKNKKDLLNKN